MTTVHLQLNSLGNRPRTVGEQPSHDGFSTKERIETLGSRAEGEGLQSRFPRTQSQSQIGSVQLPGWRKCNCRWLKTKNHRNKYYALNARYLKKNGGIEGKTSLEGETRI